MGIGQATSPSWVLHLCTSAVVLGSLSGCVGAGVESGSKPPKQTSSDVQVAAPEPTPVETSVSATSGTSAGREVKLTERAGREAPQWQVRSGDVFAFTVTSDVRAELVVESAGDSAEGESVTGRAAVFPKSRLVESVRLTKPGAYRVVALLGDSERRVIAQIHAL